VSTTADIRRAKREGKLAILYGTQDTSLVGADLDRLALLRGWESVAFTYLQSAQPLRRRLARTRQCRALQLGLATIARIEKEKMLVDFSHGGQRTIAEGIAATTARP